MRCSSAGKEHRMSVTRDSLGVEGLPQVGSQDLEKGVCRVGVCMGCGKEGLRPLRLPSGGWNMGPEEEVSIIARFPAACAARGKCEWGLGERRIVDAQGHRW